MYAWEKVLLNKHIHVSLEAGGEGVYKESNEICLYVIYHDVMWLNII